MKKKLSLKMSFCERYSVNITNKVVNMLDLKV